MLLRPQQHSPLPRLAPGNLQARPARSGGESETDRRRCVLCESALPCAEPCARVFCGTRAGFITLVGVCWWKNSRALHSGRVQQIVKLVVIGALGQMAATAPHAAPVLVSPTSLSSTSVSPRSRVTSAHLRSSCKHEQHRDAFSFPLSPNISPFTTPLPPFTPGADYNALQVSSAPARRSPRARVALRTCGGCLPSPTPVDPGSSPRFTATTDAFSRKVSRIPHIPPRTTWPTVPAAVYAACDSPRSHLPSPRPSRSASASPRHRPGSSTYSRASHSFRTPRVVRASLPWDEITKLAAATNFTAWEVVSLHQRFHTLQKLCGHALGIGAFVLFASQHGAPAAGVREWVRVCRRKALLCRGCCFCRPLSFP